MGSAPIYKVVFVGMNLEPPHNELAGKMAAMISGIHDAQLTFELLSVPNRSGKKSVGFGRLRQRYLTLFDSLHFLLRLLWTSLQPRRIVHLLLPGRRPSAILLPVTIAKFCGSSVVVSVLKNNPENLKAAKHANALICYSSSTYEAACKNVDPGKVVFISPASGEQPKPGVLRNPHRILFMAIPWRTSDLVRRGLFLLQGLISVLETDDCPWIFTVLNRTGKHESILLEMVRRASNVKVEVVSEEVSDVAFHMSRSGMLLIPHMDDQCPDPALSAIESLECGCPVITTKFNSYSEDIRQGQAGVICETSAESFASAVRSVCSSNEEYSKNAQILAHEGYQMRTFLHEHRRVYQALMAS